MTTVREWKPGDVIDIDGERAFIQVMSNGDLYVEFADYKNLGGCDLKNVTTEKVRPLVVIDPEDREQVERLVREMRLPVEVAAPADRLQAALREFAAAVVRPEEPTAMWSVVVDAADEHWVRVLGPDFTDGWVRAGSLPSNGKWTDYRDIDAVKVLSDGIPA